MLFALILAAAQPWLEMQSGPMVLHETGRAGIGTGPMVRFDMGMELTQRFAAELWLQGALESAPLRAPGDEALVGGGLAGRLEVGRLSDRLTLWARGGAGWLTADTLSGPTGFAGAALMFQPFVKRFTIGLEADALAGRRSLGFALLPSLRCSL